MNDTQVCFVWYDLAVDGAIRDTSRFDCFDGHGIMHPFANFKTTWFECLACDSRVYPGIKSIEKMRYQIAEALSTNGFVR